MAKGHIWGPKVRRSLFLHKGLWALPGVFLKGFSPREALTILGSRLLLFKPLDTPLNWGNSAGIRHAEKGSLTLWRPVCFGLKGGYLGGDIPSA